MSNVRARIAEIEARRREGEEGRDDTSKEMKNEAVTGKRKRFIYPGKRSRAQDPDQPALSLSSTQKPKPSGITDFEAHLQEVWSVRRNIHHKQPPSSTNSGSKTSLLPGGLALTQADKYSRHGAIPAQQTHSPRNLMLNKDKSIGKRDEPSLEIRRSPLQEQNSIETPWNVRKPNKPSYSEISKQSMGSPAPDTEPSPTTAKRRPGGGGAEPVRICREDFEPVVVTRRDPTEKVNYAKRMAKGYLRSVGIGEYTPKRDSYLRDPDSPKEEGKVTKWKRTDSDEFDF